MFEDGGSVTARNASGINDGGASLIPARETVARARARGLCGLLTVEAVSTAAMDPELMGYAPVLALQDPFQRTGTAPTDPDVIELSEAFASQAVAVVGDAKLDPARVKPIGGATALGHPVGVAGAILTLRVAKHLVRADKELGVVTMCIGGGRACCALPPLGMT